MGVSDIYKGLTFDGINSKDYGIYITGDAVYNAPERDIESIDIPGRNGSFILDNGRFNNIVVTYPAGTFGADQPDFAEKIREFRNLLASRKGYKRLEDEYNADEYREAVYRSGLDVSPSSMGRAGQFNLVFECKPQRFLTSGETARTLTSGSDISNPTLFDAHPLLKFNSSGADESISIGGQTLDIKSEYLGIIPLNLNASGDVVTIKNTASYKAGDPITFGGVQTYFSGLISGTVLKDAQLTDPNGLTYSRYVTGNNFVRFQLSATEVSFTAGTPSTVSKSIDLTIDTRAEEGSETHTIILTIAYDGASTITMTWTVPTYTATVSFTTTDMSTYNGTVDSSLNNLENVDVYIDLDIGEAYSIDGSDNVISLNNFVNIGGELPTLPPGDTTITYTTTIYNFEITPRWWMI